MNDDIKDKTTTHESCLGTAGKKTGNKDLNWAYACDLTPTFSAARKVEKQSIIINIILLSKKLVTDSTKARVSTLKVGIQRDGMKVTNNI